MGLERYLPNRRQSLADKIGAYWIPTFKLMLGGDGQNDGAVSSDNPLPVSVTNEGGASDPTIVAFGDGGSIDGFGRLRVSNPTTQFDSKQLHDNLPLFWNEVDGGGAGAASHSTADAATTMTVDAAGEYIIRQTKMRFNYQPGKSQQILTTFVMGAATASTVKRVGYFNSTSSGDYDGGYDGIYLEQDGTTQYIVQAKGGVKTAIAQADWSDPMDGTGASGVTVDWTKTQILLIDFEWLGVGRVRAGLVVDGAIHYFYAFNNANSLTSVYMSSPNHSVRYEIRSTGGTATLVHICSSVAAEGGEQALGVLQYASTSGTHVVCPAENSRYAILGIKLKSSHLDTTVRLLNMALQLQTPGDFVEWQILFNPTVAGSFTYGDIVNSCCQYATGATANTVTGGFALSGGFLESGTTGGKNAVGGGSGGAEISNALRLGSDIDGTADELVLCVRPIGGSPADTSVSVEGAMFWRELT